MKTIKTQNFSLRDVYREDDGEGDAHRWVRCHATLSEKQELGILVDSKQKHWPISLGSVLFINEAERADVDYMIVDAFLLYWIGRDAHWLPKSKAGIDGFLRNPRRLKDKAEIAQILV